MTSTASLWALARRSVGFALIDENGRTSGQVICDRAAELAAVLAERASAPGSLAVCTGSPLATVVALLALSALNTRGALIGPLEAPGTIALLGRSRPFVVVHDGPMQPMMARGGVTVHLSPANGAVDSPPPIGSRPPDRTSPGRHPSHQGAFLVFRTSGTTMQPKWIAHSETTLRASLESKIRGLSRYGLEPTLPVELRQVIESISGAPRAVFLDPHTISGYTQMVHGIALGVPVIATSRFLARRALRLVATHQAGTMVVTPSMLRLMLTLPDVREHSWDHLGVIGMGGGTLHSDMVTAAEAAFDARVIQGYGSSELGGGVVNVRIHDDPEVRRHTVGRPLGGVHVRILRRDRSDAATGETGEIVVRAPQRLAVGQCPDGPTGDVVPLPTTGGAFRTGDVGYLRADGNLVVLGRLGNEITRGEEQFHPEEVEAVLEAHPAVLQALVTAEIRGHRVLVRAVCEPRPAANRDGLPGILRAWCRQRLNRARCPDVLVLAPIDTTVSGKVQRPAEVPTDSCHLEERLS